MVQTSTSVLQNRAFVELSRVLASGDSAVLSSALPLVVRGAAVPSAAIYGLVEDEMVFVAAENVPLKLRAYLEEPGFCGAPDFVAHRALAQRRTVIDAGVFGDGATAGALTALDEAAWQSGIAVPILAGGASIGVILAGARTGVVDGGTVMFLEAMANLIGAAIAKPTVKTAAPPAQSGTCAGCVAQVAESLVGHGREVAAQHGLLREMCFQPGAPPQADAMLAHSRALDRSFRRIVETVMHLPGGACGHSRRSSAMTHVVDTAVHAARPALAAAHVEVEVVCAPACDFVGDPDLLAVAVRHLVVNAAEACATPGPDRASIPSSRRCVRVSVRTEGPNAVVYVEDSGLGVPHDLRARVFEPSVTTKGPGRGLGLAVARHVIESHGGWLELGASELGGARVSMHIPARGTSLEDSRKAATGSQIHMHAPRRRGSHAA